MAEAADAVRAEATPPMEEAADAVQAEATPPMVRIVLGTMTIGPSVGDAHSDGTHTGMKSWCQTPPEVAAEQLKALVAAAHAYTGSGEPEERKVLVDTASAYQNWQTEKILGDIFAANPELCGVSS